MKEAEARRMASELCRAGALAVAELGSPDDPENGWTVMAVGACQDEDYPDPSDS
jgi:hypothetical protein